MPESGRCILDLPELDEESVETAIAVAAAAAAAAAYDRQTIIFNIKI
jgi:hypothetical protein